MGFVSAHGNFQTEIIGQAAADVDKNTGDLLVMPNTAVPFQQGEVKATEISNDVNTKGGSSSYKGSVNTTNVIKAAYLKDATNRDYFPIIRKGEQVTLVNTANTDIWYWKTDGRNDGNRRTDRYRLSVSGSLENSSDIRSDNSYYIEMNTFDSQCIEMATSQANGEKHKYMIKIDAKDSKVFIGDGDQDMPNMIIIDSEFPEVIICNHKKSFINLKGENIAMYCEGDISIEAKKNIIFKAGENMTLQSGKDMTQEIGAAWKINYGSTGTCHGGGNMNFEVAHMSIKGS